MIDVSTVLFLLAMVIVPISWTLPRSWSFDVISVLTLLSIAAFSPISAAWFLVSVLMMPLMLQLGDQVRHRGAVAAVLILVFLASFSFAKLFGNYVWIGVAFATLRHLHVTVEWWLGRLAAPTLRQYWRYQLFLPVIVIGPIHRIENFNRQIARRRWSTDDFFVGAERALVGAFMSYVIGSWVIGKFEKVALSFSSGSNQFIATWISSAFEWVSLYFVFAGMSSVALGLSLMVGLRLEENFDQPWRATSLVDFWTRWHKTLSSFVLDYVFRPVSAFSRNAFVGLAAAMLAIGLWHEFSIYYILWSAWQVLGISLTRLATHHISFDLLPMPIRTMGSPILVFAWLSLSRPMIELSLGFIS